MTDPNAPAGPPEPDPANGAVPPPSVPGTPAGSPAPTTGGAPAAADPRHAAPVPPPPPGYGQPPYSAPQQPYGQQPPAAGGGQYAAPGYGQHASGQPGPGYPQPYATPSAKSPLISIFSLVSGIVGFLMNVAWGLGFLFAVAAVVLGFIGRRREPQAKGFWLTGIILGFVGIVIAIVFWISIAIFFATFSTGFYNMY